MPHYHCGTNFRLSEMHSDEYALSNLGILISKDTWPNRWLQLQELASCELVPHNEACPVHSVIFDTHILSLCCLQDTRDHGHRVTLLYQRNAIFEAPQLVLHANLSIWSFKRNITTVRACLYLEINAQNKRSTWYTATTVRPATAHEPLPVAVHILQNCIENCTHAKRRNCTPVQTYVVPTL